MLNLRIAYTFVLAFICINGNRAQQDNLEHGQISVEQLLQTTHLLQIHQEVHGIE